jgi:hypothetical protein
MMDTADGRVTPRCFAQGSLGDLNEADPDVIWNGETAMELRKYIKADRIHSVCAGAACKFVQNMEASEVVTVIQLPETAP